ncbi:MAG TPA: SDR family NAD(P)-dependent oxidoreductase [Bacteroidales bacterium]|jgi:short-subunit dehydrogenase|nr:SDR family NAD(P)-dependent oxidoreductase [Bacteroidales bacterium]
MSDFYKDKVVLITGGSMGIGKELAIQTLHAGAKVVITGRNKERLQSTLNSLSHPERVLIHAGDVACDQHNRKLVSSIIDHFGKLDIVISNAGISAYGDLEQTRPDVINELVDTNIKGSVFLYNAVIPELKKTGGSILFVSSLAGLRGLPSYSLYSLTKMALTALAQSIRIETKRYGVLVGIAYVGFTMNEDEKRTYSPEGILEQVPKRNHQFLSERSVTASKILDQIRKRQGTRIHSITGKFLFLINKFSPALITYVLEKAYKNNHTRLKD